MTNPSKIHLSRIPNPTPQVENLFCFSCKSMLTGFVNLCQRCKWKFCIDCYSSRILGGANFCLACQSPIDQMVEEMQDMTQLQSIIVKCTYCNSGCPEILSYEKLILHELNCSFGPFTCSKCKQANLIIKHIEQHKSECPFSKVPCPECHDLIANYDLPNHLERNCLINFSSCYQCEMKIYSQELHKHHLDCLGKKKCTVCGFPSKNNHNCDIKKGIQKIIHQENLNSYQSHIMRKEHDVLQLISEDTKQLVKNSELELKQYLKGELSMIKTLLSGDSAFSQIPNFSSRLSNLETSIKAVSSENTKIQNTCSEMKSLIASQNQNISLSLNPLKESLEKCFEKGINSLSTQISDSFQIKLTKNTNELITSIQENLKSIDPPGFASVKSCFEELKKVVSKLDTLNSTFATKKDLEGQTKFLNEKHDEIIKSVKDKGDATKFSIEQAITNALTNMNTNLEASKNFLNKVIKEPNQTIVDLLKNKDGLNLSKQIEDAKSNLIGVCSDLKVRILGNDENLGGRFTKLFEDLQNYIESNNVTLIGKISDINFFNNKDRFLLPIKESILILFDEKITPKFKEILLSLDCLETENFIETKFGCKLDKGMIFKDQHLSNNHFLYYFDWRGDILHLKNLISSEIITQQLYYNRYLADAAFHKNEIYVCGGGDKNEVLLDTCAIFNLILKTKNMESKLTEKKCLISLCSTTKFIFCLGGSLTSGNYVETCEYFNSKEKKWKEVKSLNNPECGICSYFDLKQYIFTLGGYSKKQSDVLSKIERYDLSSMESSWQLINLSCSRRMCGSCFKFNKNEILLFGGDCCSDNFFYLFNANSISLKKLDKKFDTSYYISSRPIYYNDHIWIVNHKSTKVHKLYPIDLEIEEFSIDF